MPASFDEVLCSKCRLFLFRKMFSKTWKSRSSSNLLGRCETGEEEYHGHKPMAFYSRLSTTRKIARRSPLTLKVFRSDAFSLFLPGVTSLQFFPSGICVPRFICFPLGFRGSPMAAILSPLRSEQALNSATIGLGEKCALPRYFRRCKRLIIDIATVAIPTWKWKGS
jgi:hypothetical protein